MYSLFNFAILVILINCASSEDSKLAEHPLSDEFITFINSQQKQWKAGRNFDINTSLDFISTLMGTIVYSNRNASDPSLWKSNSKKMLVNFDARKKWPYCESLRKIRDQGSCGSCWAVGVASVMTDRICTSTFRTENIYFSEEDILTCCSDCLFFKSSLCGGGFVEKAWSFARKSGVVSGGPYRSRGGCKAYQFKPYRHLNEYSEITDLNAIKQMPVCVKQCTANKKLNYVDDKKLFKSVYYVSDPMSEIYTFGPITAVMKVHADFLSYKDGVYRRIEADQNRFIGYHTIKILGWGFDVNTQTKYWLAANSWNVKWGDQGFFKIVRGENHCDIETHMTAGQLS